MKLLLVVFVFVCEACAVFDNSTCGAGKTCVTYPSKCMLLDIRSCKLGLSLNRTGDVLELEMFTHKLNSTSLYDSYMAVAFQPSKCKELERTGRKCMADSFVSECSSLDGALMTAALSWNNARPANVRLENAAALQRAVELTTELVEFNVGQTFCKLRQKIAGVDFAGLPNADKVALHAKAQFAQVLQVDEATEYGILMAVGSVKHGEPSKHKKGSYFLAPVRQHL